MRRVLGSVPYLNARPLVAWFTQTEEGRRSGFEVVEAPPSQLASLLRDGTIDCGLLSSIETFQPGYGFVPGISISADGPVESVRLFTKVPPAQIRTVALDSSSKTSVALVRLILEQRYGVSPRYEICPPDPSQMLRDADAALLIGDTGFNDVPDCSILDLGREWKEWTGLPFVYAVWVGRQERLDESLADVLWRAKEWGLPRFDALAEQYAGVHKTTPDRARHYFHDVMVYGWNDQLGAGLGRFRELCLASGLQLGTNPSEITSEKQSN